MKQINRRRQRQYKNFLFAKMLLDFVNDVFRESVGECVFWLWWFAMLENCDHDKTSASNAYARLEHLRSSSECLVTNFRNGANSGSAESGLASGVSSRYDASGETTYNPYRSMNAEHVSKYEQVFAFDTLGLGNMVSKVSHEDVRPNGKTLGDGLNYSFEYVYDENFAHRLVRAGNRWYKYDANGNVIFEKDLPEGTTLEDDENTVTMSRVQTIRENVYAIDEGWGLFANDSPSARGRTNKRSGGRTYTWNERNQLVATVDDNRSTSYVYDYNGTRTNKYSRGTETLYFNQFYSMRFDAGVGYGNGQVVKHIYLGDTRIVTKLGSLKNDSYSEEYHKQYFYHSDHLGSASLISDFEGREYQRIEYTPYGETWVEKTSNTGMEYLPYKFTGKERDEETGLYYFGARYLDPQYSRWLSADPALADYIPLAPLDDKSRRHNEKLPGMGGVFNTVNLQLYHYSANNPITYTDPNGREIIIGITTSDSFWGKIIGEHAFIMCIDEIEPEKSIMLDASGRYGGGRTADVLDGYQASITVEAYLKYFDTDEKLKTFKLNISNEEEKNIKDAILVIEGYSWLQCADRASEVLNESYSKEIKKSRTPIGLMKTLQNYAKNHPEKIIIKNYDFKTNSEVKENE